MVNWQKIAIDDLRKYEHMKQGLLSIREKQAALDLQSGVIRSSFSDREPVSGSGGSGAEDRLISNIVERQRLDGNYQAVEKLVVRMDKALSMLDDQERLVLERFYINRSPGYIDRLCEELGYERAQIYRKKDAALYKFTVTLYGLVDL